MTIFERIFYNEIDIAPPKQYDSAYSAANETLLEMEIKIREKLAPEDIFLIEKLMKQHEKVVLVRSCEYFSQGCKFAM